MTDVSDNTYKNGMMEATPRVSKTPVARRRHNRITALRLSRASKSLLSLIKNDMSTHLKPAHKITVSGGLLS